MPGRLKRVFGGTFEHGLNIKRRSSDKHRCGGVIFALHDPLHHLFFQFFSLAIQLTYFYIFHLQHHHHLILLMNVIQVNSTTHPFPISINTYTLSHSHTHTTPTRHSFAHDCVVVVNLYKCDIVHWSMGPAHSVCFMAIKSELLSPHTQRNRYDISRKL